MFVRLFPEMNDFGLEKILRFTLLGLPSFYLGFILLSHVDLYQKFLDTLSVAGLVLSVSLFVMALRNPNLDSYWIGNSGYQLTGMVLMLSCFASFSKGRGIFVVASLIGIALSGNVSAFCVVFVCLIAKAISDRGLPNSLLRGFFVYIAFALAFSHLVMTPPSISRTIGKAKGLISQLWPSPNNILIQELPQDLSQGGSRLELFQASFITFLENPWIGVGTGNFTYGIHKYSHNLVLEFAVEYGLLGLIVIGFLLYKIGVNLRKSNDMFISCAVFGVVLVSLFSGYFGNKIFLFCLGLLSGEMQIKQLNSIRVKS
jgi:O-antigen ligase